MTTIVEFSIFFEEAERNTAIKDTMREQCVPQMVDSWYQIMVSRNREISFELVKFEILKKYGMRIH